MRVQLPSNNCPKAACSVSEMASRCSLSRARFYELVRSGVMPHPCYDLRTHRPLYPTELQELCLEIRRTNTAFDGSYVIFNNRRRCAPDPPLVTAKRPLLSRNVAAAADTAPDPRMTELADSMRGLGVTASNNQIEAAIKNCYPAGLADVGIEVAIRTVFRFLRRTSAA